MICVALGDMVHREDTSSSNSTGSKDLWREVWGAKLQPKLKLFVWKILKGILPTRVNLKKRKIPIDNKCPICKVEEETIEHLLFGCDWVRTVWFGSQFH